MNRCIDETGRLVIPKEYRTQLGLENGSEVSMELKGKKIIITNPENNIDVETYIREEILPNLHGKNELTIGAREICLRILEKISDNTISDK